jgi:class 3 adenylate cyclase
MSTSDATKKTNQWLSIKDWSLGVKLSLAMLLIALPAVLGSAYYNLRGSLNSVDATEVRNLEQLAESIAGQLRQTITSHRQLAAFIGTQPSLLIALQRPKDPKAISEVKGRFNSVISTNADAELLMLLTPTGEVLTSSDPELVGKNFGFREYFKEAIQGRSHTTNIIVGSVAGNSGVFYSVPLRDLNGVVQGAAVLKMRGSSLGNMVERAARTDDITPFVIDSEGVVIYHSEKAYRYMSLIPLSDEAQKRIVADKRFRLEKISSLNMKVLGERAIEASNTGHVRYVSPLTNSREIAGFSPVGNHAWTVIVSEQESVFSAPLKKLFADVWLSLSVVGIIIVIVALFMSRLLVRPIQILARAARAVERGDYDKASTNIKTNDEIGQLARSFNSMLVGIRDREKVKDVFGRMVSPEVREKLLEGSLSLGGETARVAVLFSDIREFSSISERMTAQEVVTMLNEYLTEMSVAVRNWGGYINNFIGDAIVVVFGAPMEQPDIETRAVCAALEMRQRLESLNRRRKSIGLELLRSGIGISTGEVVAGQMGSLDRFLYTVIGDAVNVAARLEALTKEFPDYPILINDATYEKLKDMSGIELKDLGNQPVKGRLQTVQVWGVRPQ